MSEFVTLSSQLRQQGGTFPGAGGGRPVLHLERDFLLPEPFGGLLQNSQHRHGQSGLPQRPPLITSAAGAVGT